MPSSPSSHPANIAAVTRKHDPLNQGLPDGHLYHYASQAGIRGVIGEHELWATNIEFLNDRTEFDHGVEIIKQAIAARRSQNNEGEASFFEWLDFSPQRIKKEDVFVISFSEEPDLLSQWRGYTPKNCGYSIGFDSPTLEDIGWEIDRMTLVKCVYTESAKAELIDDLLNSYLSHWREASRIIETGEEWNTPSIADSFAVRVAFAASAMKDETFSEEREWRLVGANPKRRPLNFRDGSSFLIPYVKFHWGGPKAVPPCQPIVAITVGPGPNQDLALKAVKMLLNANQIQEIEPTRSEIPYRTW